MHFFQDHNDQSNFNVFLKNSTNQDYKKKSEENTKFSSDEYLNNYNKQSFNYTGENRINNFITNLPFSFNINSMFKDSSSPVVEFMGINLYCDDILILILLFILYKEGVKDEMLYISLILLLLS